MLQLLEGIDGEWQRWRTWLESERPGETGAYHSHRVSRYPRWLSDFHRLFVCDVPGLIDGAHRNVGLGHAFLRHIERCKILVLLLDMAGADGRAPWDDYQSLLRELELYDPGLLDKPRLVVGNKMDEPAAEANLKGFKRRIRKTPVLRSPPRLTWASPNS